MATMDDKQLRRLSRRDLLGLLEELSRENDRLRAELDEANKKLEDRHVRLQRCGSMAEAALELGGVFEAADRAVAIYRQSVEEAARVQPTQAQPTQAQRTQGQGDQGRHQAPQAQRTVARRSSGSAGQPGAPAGRPAPPAGQHYRSGSRRADANH